jgi:ATP-dependent Clp protease ATP-binding subunit ClpB
VPSAARAAPSPQPPEGRSSATCARAQEARRYIAEQGFDPVYGARPLRRLISRAVETRIGRALVAGDVRDGAVIRVGLADGALAVTYDNPA